MADKAMTEEIMELKQRLHEYENDVKRSNLAYQQMKQENEELSAQIEVLIKDNSSQMEELEQERYSLQLKLSQQMKMTESYEEEMESIKVSTARQQQTILDKLETEHNAKMGRLNKKISSLQFDLEHCQSSESRLAVENEKLRCLVAQHQQDLEAQSRVRCDSSGEDAEEMSRELHALRIEKLSMSQEVMEARNKSDQLEKLTSRLKFQLQQQMTDTEEKQCELTSYYNTITHLREEIQELKVELDLARMEASTMAKKGNSLFAEVEDRRIEAEKQLISMKVQNESLKKQLEITKQNLHSVKLKMAALLQTCSVQADKNYMDQLSSQLSRATGEVRFLTLKLHESEVREKTLRDELLMLKAAPGGDDAHYIKYLQSLLQKKEVKMVELEKEMQTQRMLLLAESDNLAKSGQKLYSAEQQVETYRSLSVKQSLKIEELKLKYEPNAVVKGTVRKVIVERIPLSTSASSSDNQIEPEIHKNADTKADDLGKENDAQLSSQSLTSETEPLYDDQKVCIVNNEESGQCNDDQCGDKERHRQSSSGKQIDSVSSDLPEQENSPAPLLKSILIPPGNRKSSNTEFRSDPSIVPPKFQKKVTLSEYVREVDLATNEMHCSRMEDGTANDLDSTTFNQPQPRQRQSKVIAVHTDNDCKTQ